jgi:signal recognition particle GTPase
MIVGLTGAGKTTCYEVLADSMTTLRKDKQSADIRY